MSFIRVGVLRGGPSLEHEVSLKTGEMVLRSLPKKYSAKDIFISKDGCWHLNGKPYHHDQIFRNIDVVFNALHGEYGEDGKVQQLLESYGVPYTGSGVLASAVGMNKILARNAFKNVGLRVPTGLEIVFGGDIVKTAKEVFKNMPPPWVVKYPFGGCSVGVAIAHSFDNLVLALEKNSFFQPQPNYSKILIEEHISGREATCGVIDEFRNQKHYALPIVEIIPPAKIGFFSYEAKYNGETKELCPSNFDMRTKKEIENMAVLAHNAIGGRHYSRSDFIVSKKGIYILEINTLPGLTQQSLLPKALNAVGSSRLELIEHLITLAIARR
ncbi:MAG: D-alanine--D-alanine ligase [Patescibacteria group bacterium]